MDVLRGVAAAALVALGCGGTDTVAAGSTSSVPGAHDAVAAAEDSSLDIDALAVAPVDVEPELAVSSDTTAGGTESDVVEPVDVLEPVDALEPIDLVETPDVAEDTGAPDVGPKTFASCFQGQLPGGGAAIDYDSYGPIVGSHCKGTNHQDITGVQRVVFVGDSISVGTPPQLSGEWYRVIVAKALASKFGLTAPDLVWENVDPSDGMTWTQQSGDFWSCAKWGARTDDLTKKPHEQLVACNPEAERQKKTLVVTTIGGNDIFSWAQDLVKGVPVADLWVEAEAAVADLEASVHWLKDDPTRFPNGVYLVFATTYEFTDLDSAKDFATCPGADIIAMDTGLVSDDFIAMVTWMNGEYMRIAVENGVDVGFMGELNCGHGHMNDDPAGRCYHGPGAPLWLDITCMHPSAAGHAGIADMFLSIIGE